MQPWSIIESNCATNKSEIAQRKQLLQLGKPLLICFTDIKPIVKRVACLIYIGTNR